MTTATLVPAEQRLLAFLVRAGKVDAHQAETVERAHGRSLIERLNASGVISEHEIASVLATRLQLPLVPPSIADVDEDALHLIDEATATAFMVLPIGVDKAWVAIAMANPLDHDAIRRVEFLSGRPAKISVSPRSEILQTISKRYGRERALATMLADVPPANDLEVVGRSSTDVTTDVSALAREAEQAPVVKMVNLILLEALKAGASDIHVEPGSAAVVVRFRVNGVLEKALEIPKWLQAPVVTRLKVMANLDIAERRIPQDGRLTVRHESHRVDMRISSLPTSEGETIVARILDTTRTPWDLDAIGLGERDLAVIRRLVRRPQGMLLVTGPTGSGKTTTLYAILKGIHSPERKIVTIENPIEYKLAGISQVDVNDKQGLTFATALRSVLRQDPDVILVGEIRDHETAETAFRAAQTGHLVLSTMHTNDTASTITRLVDLGVEPFVIGSSLMAVVAQRLVRTVCDRCAGPATLDDELRRTLGVASVSGLRAGVGCPSCRDSGFASRTGCYEVMEISKGIRHFIVTKAPESALRATAEEEGMRSVLADAAQKVESGRTTAAEVVRVIDVGSEPKLTGEKLDTVRVLVVDDQKDIRFLVRKVLQREPIAMEIEEAESGAEALAKIEANRPHLIVLDLMMPDMDGTEVCRRLRANLKTALIPILMLTARTDAESKSSGFLAGADDYVTKPFEGEKLRTRVRWLLDGAYRLPPAPSAATG